VSLSGLGADSTAFSMSHLATKCTEKTNWRKREREFFETDNQACIGRVTFCYSLTSWTTGLWSVTLNGHTWVDRVWMRSSTLPIESNCAYQPFVNFFW